MADEHKPEPPKGDAAKSTDHQVGSKEGKKGDNFWKKYKWLLIGGLAVVLVMLWFFLRGGSASGSASTASQQTAANNGIDPGTGYLYGSPADIAALGGSGS